MKRLRNIILGTLAVDLDGALLFLSCFFLFGNSAFAEHRVLFVDHGIQAVDYDEQLSLLKPDDTIEFSNGISFPVVAVLDHGATALIIEIPGNKVLRIPLHAGETRWKSGRTYVQQMTDYLEGHRMLSATLPMPKLYEDLSHPPEYLVVEKINVKFSLRDWIYGDVQVSETENAAIESALIELARQTAGYEQLRDFSAKNVVWDGKRIWVPDAKGTGNIKAANLDDPWAMQIMLRPRPALLQRAEEAARKERHARLCAEWLTE